MGNRTILAVFLLCTTAIMAQDKKMCNAEALLNKPDIVIQKDYVNIGKIKNVTISVETITDITNNQKLTALDLEGTFEVGSSTTKSVLLDPDEVDAMIALVQNMTDNYFKQPAPATDKEYSFITKSGFELGAYWNNGWSAYIKIDTRDNHTDVELNKDEFMAFASFIRQAKSRM